MSTPSTGMPMDMASNGAAIGTSRTATFIYILVGMNGFATVFFAGRVASRAAVLRTWKLDDWLLSIAWLLQIGVLTLDCLGTRFGIGQDFSTFSKSDVITNTKINFTLSAIFNPVLAFTKLSICVTYLRVFDSYARDKYAMLGCAIFLIAYLLVVQTLTFVPCLPVQYPWNFTPQTPPECIDGRLSLLISVASNILSDVWIMLVVYTRVLPLRLIPSRKFTLLVIVSVGWLAVAASIVRLIRILAFYQGKEQDLSLATLDIEMWTALEANVSIFCASAPAIRPLLMKLRPRVVYSEDDLRLRRGADDTEADAATLHDEKLASRRQADSRFVEDMGWSSFPMRTEEEQAIRDSRFTFTPESMNTEEYAVVENAFGTFEDFGDFKTEPPTRSDSTRSDLTALPDINRKSAYF